MSKLILPEDYNITKKDIAKDFLRTHNFTPNPQIPNKEFCCSKCQWCDMSGDKFECHHREIEPFFFKTNEFGRCTAFKKL